MLSKKVLSIVTAFLFCNSTLFSMPYSDGLDLVLGQRSGSIGAVLALPLQLDNDGTSVGFICDINFDSSALSLALQEGAPPSESHQVLAANPSAGVLRLIVSPRTAPFAPLQNGAITWVQVVVAATAPAGDYPLVISNILASDAQAGPVAAVTNSAGVITVRSDNQPPQAQAGILTLVEDTPAIAVLAASDADSDPLVFSVTAPPGKGHLFLTDPSSGAYTYVPFLNAEGADQFSFVVSDGMAVSDVALVNLHIEGRNDAPTAVSVEIVTDEDQSGSAVPLVSDVDADDSHNFQVLSPASYGSASVSGSGLSYVPQQDYHGTDSFTFAATDSGLATVEGTALVTVTSVNDAPQSAAAVFHLDEDTSQALVPSVVDVDHTSFLYSVITPPEHGQVTVTSNGVVYTPHQHYNGSDQFVFRATDAAFASVEATALVTIEPVNDPPAATSAQMVACLDLSGDAVTPLVEDVDLALEGDTFFFAVLTQGEHGVASTHNNQLVYAPEIGFLGNDSFSFRATDAAGAFVDGFALVTVNLFDRVSVQGLRAQGLLPLLVSAGSNCGSSGVDFQWLDETGTLLGSGVEIVLPPLAETSSFELIGVDNGTLSEIRQQFVVLVHPAGVDLNGDGLNNLADLQLVTPTWLETDAVYEADGDGRLTVLDLLFINTDGL